MKNKMLLIGTLFIFIIVCTVNIGYSAFSASLSISGDAFVRVDADIRITNIEFYSSANGGLEVYSPKFSKNLTSMSVRLPNVNSSVTYKITVTNKTNKYFSTNEISEKIITNEENVSYRLDGMGVYNVYQGNNIEFYITFTTSLANQEMDLTLSYDFKTVDVSSWVYGSSGEGKLFTVPYNATYKIELWGASGGDFSPYTGGRGAYAVGIIVLAKNTPLYFYVGGKGSDDSDAGGYNGGGTLSTGQHVYGSSGGGATDVRTIGGAWNDANSLRSRIMVAGGGGGANYRNYGYGEGNGGAGGTLVGLNGVSLSHTSTYGWGYGTGGSQTNGGIALWLDAEHKTLQPPGEFGQGGGIEVFATPPSGYDVLTQTGGGSGYYGGSASEHGGGGGGSSYISGYLGCVAITSASSLTPKCSESVASTNISCSYHYSGYIFTNGQMISGNDSMTSPTGVVETGHTGDGFARISLIIS